MIFFSLIPTLSCGGFSVDWGSIFYFQYKKVGSGGLLSMGGRRKGGKRVDKGTCREAL